MEFLSLKGGYTGSSESTLVKMQHCWKSHVTTQMYTEYVLRFSSSADFFLKLFYLIFDLKNTIRVSNSLGLDQAWRFIGPDLGQNCFQRVPTDKTCRHLFDKT